MKTLLRSLAAGVCFTALPLFAEMVDTSSGEGGDALGFEFDLQAGYIGEADVKHGSNRINNFDERNFLGRFLVLPRTPVGILRLGAEYEIYDFDVNNFSPIPDQLQSAAAVIGLDTKFSDSLLIRFESKPGFYFSDEIRGKNFNVPFILGGTYLYSSTFQIVFGVGVDFESEFPVLPGGGFRWKFAPQWVLNATAPTPRLEFEVNRNLMLYVGAELRGKTFRVDNDFGDNRGDTRFNDAVVSYREIRTGGGVMWKLGEACKLSVEGGYMPYRKFDFHRVDIGYQSDGGAPYGALSFNAAF